MVDQNGAEIVVGSLVALMNMQMIKAKKKPKICKRTGRVIPLPDKYVAQRCIVESIDEEAGTFVIKKRGGRAITYTCTSPDVVKIR